jgi:hypothetical protein
LLYKVINGMWGSSHCSLKIILPNITFKYAPIYA